MAESETRDRELQELGEAAFKALRRSYELIQRTEKLVARSRESIRFSTLGDPNPAHDFTG